MVKCIKVTDVGKADYRPNHITLLVVVSFITVIIDDDLISVFDGRAEILEALLINWVSEDVVVGVSLQSFFLFAVAFDILKLFKGVICHDLHTMQIFSCIFLLFDRPFTITCRDSRPEVSNVFF